MRWVVPLLALLVAAFAAAPAEAATRSCRVKGSETQAQNRYARLYELRGNLYACMRASGRQFILDSSHDDGYVTSSGWSRPKVAGRFAAWVSTYTDVSCKADCPPNYEATRSSIVVHDLRRRRPVQAVSGEFPFVLTDRGALAWLVQREGTAELHAAAPGGSRHVVDSGAIDPASLRAYYSLVLWTKDAARYWVRPV